MPNKKDIKLAILGSVVTSTIFLIKDHLDKKRRAKLIKDLAAETYAEGTIYQKIRDGHYEDDEQSKALMDYEFYKIEYHQTH